LVEFKNAFDLNFNLEFKFKSVEGKFVKQFLSFLSGPSPSPNLFSFSFSFTIAGLATSAFWPITGPIPYHLPQSRYAAATNFGRRRRT
jgi:hypothetical protein